MDFIADGLNISHKFEIMMSMAKENLCRKCQHFCMSWDSTAPYSCRKFAFKSKEIPCFVISRETQEDCHYFEPKKKKKTGLDLNDPINW